MARPITCECGSCDKCKRRERMRRWYWCHRDRACEIARQGRERRLEAAREYDRARGYRPAATIKTRARRAVSIALGNGTLTKGPCEHAADDCRGAIQAHHDDYSKPLQVRWLCRRHHGIEHRRDAPTALHPEQGLPS